MRKITSRRNEMRKQKRNGTILVVFLIVVLFGSVFGVIVNSFGSQEAEGNLKYKGHTFLYNNGFWTVKDISNAVFTYNPQETESVILDRKNIVSDLSKYSGVPVYIYSEDSASELEIYRNLFYVSERIQNACPLDKECSEDIPTKDCTSNFVIIEVSNQSEIYEDQNCVYIKGQKENLIKISDEFLFSLYGIN